MKSGSVKAFEYVADPYCSLSLVWCRQEVTAPSEDLVGAGVQKLIRMQESAKIVVP
jgi:hypothetical protein